MLAEALARLRVGGAFWAARPDLPAGRDLLIAPDDAGQARAMLDAAASEGLAERAVLIGPWASRHGVPVIARLCDPWHLADAAVEVRVGAKQELALVTALLGKDLKIAEEGPFAEVASLHSTLAAQLLVDTVYRDPFTGRAITAAGAAALLGEWRALIDANRPVAAVFGVARWKRVTADALLWDGSGPVRHGGRRAAGRLGKGAPVIAWRSRTSPATLAVLDAKQATIGEIEDGMIRSAGLGANCVPPLSVIVDAQGPHFDPRQASTLETILQHGDFPPELCARAAALRAALVVGGISKYASGPIADTLPPPSGRRRVLVAGQVEDDRAMLLGGGGCSNRDLLARTRAAEPGAELIWRPHPDVEAGHRRGQIPEEEVRALADRVDRDTPIAALLNAVDAVHVISSLAGFEALLRGVAVTTYGVPFYAGWGLTRDRGPVPERRNRRCSLDELVAAVLILYPRYVDPVTRLPCPPEVLVARLAAGEARVSSPLVKWREIEGRIKRLARR